MAKQVSFHPSSGQLKSGAKVRVKSLFVCKGTIYFANVKATVISPKSKFLTTIAGEQVLVPGYWIEVHGRTVWTIEENLEEEDERACKNFI